MGVSSSAKKNYNLSMLGLAVIVALATVMFKFLVYDRDEDRQGWSLVFAIFGFALVIGSIIKVFLERY